VRILKPQSGLVYVMSRITFQARRLTGWGSGLTVPDMVDRVSKLPTERRVSAWEGLLLIVLTTLFAWAPGSEHPAGYSADRARICSADRLDQAGFVEITPAQAPAEQELETFAEQLEERVLAGGQPSFELEPSPEGAPPEYGVVVGWVVRTSSLRSSSARGPPIG
jgi:hypothetical protein